MYIGAKEKAELSTILEISNAYGISKNHLMKVTYELGKLGLIETIRGRGGGIRLALLPEEITIGAVVRKTEDDFNLVECFNCTTNRCVITPVCKLRNVLHQALDAYITVLDQYTLKDLLSNKEELGAILFKK